MKNSEEKDWGVNYMESKLAQWSIGRRGIIIIAKINKNIPSDNHEM